MAQIKGFVAGKLHQGVPPCRKLYGRMYSGMRQP